MMGRTKVSEIKTKLKDAARENKRDLWAWITQKKAESRKNGPQSRLLAELDWLRELLHETSDEKKGKTP